MRRLRLAFLALFGLVALVLLFLFRPGSAPEKAGTASIDHLDSVADSRNSDPPAEGSTDPSASERTWLDEADALNGVSRDRVEAFLAAEGRSAGNLLAAFSLVGDPALLAEALERHPDHPAVLIIALSQDEFPGGGDRVGAAERLRAIEPENALGHYLLGEAHLAAGDLDATLTAMTTGAEKPNFHATLDEHFAGLSAFHEFNGASPELATIQAAFGAPLPNLERMRDLARTVAAIDGHEETTVLIGVAMGNHLSQGQGSRLLINQLVGLSIEEEFAAGLDPETFNPYLQRTHGELLTDIERQKAELQSLLSNLPTMEAWSSQEAADYARRVIEVGEEQALRERTIE